MITNVRIRTLLGDRDVINAATLARLYGVSVGWIEEEAAAGRLPALPAGRRYLFHLPTVSAALSKRAAEGK